MAEVLLAVMAVAAVCYVILGGADFGAGMAEPWLSGQGRPRRVDAAIAPVWEANHVWLVLVAVLAFVGFPRLYVEVATFLHIPLLLILLGIVARGSAFAFRHYDPRPGALGPWYSAAFRVGSAMTPLFLGVVVAATMHGRMGACGGRTFYACYVAPWNTLFSWTAGIFVCALFAFQGTALLAAEHEPPSAEGALPYTRLARRLHGAVIVTGGLVFVAAWASDSPWFAAFRTSPLGYAAMALATGLVPVVAFSFHRGRPQRLRLAMAAQTSAIMLGFFGPSYPVLVRMAGGDHVQLPQAAAPPAVLHQLAIAVAVGLCLILPSLGYLIAVYKRRSPRGSPPTPNS